MKKNRSVIVYLSINIPNQRIGIYFYDVGARCNPDCSVTHADTHICTRVRPVPLSRRTRRARCRCCRKTMSVDARARPWARPDSLVKVNVNVNVNNKACGSAHRAHRAAGLGAAGRFAIRCEHSG